MNGRVVVDIDVLSFLAKRNTRAALDDKDMTGRLLCVCFQTVAELELWALIRRWGPGRRTQLVALLGRSIVLPYDIEMSRRWAEVTAYRRSLGRPIECGDAMDRRRRTALRRDAPLA